MMKIIRRESRIIKVGNIRIGGGYPIAIQSMLKVETARVEEALRQINRLEDAGCEIVRLAIKDRRDAAALGRIRPKTRLPLVADIHFDWRLALQAISNGADKIRLNPGNIFKENEVAQVVRALKSARIPLRIGVNSGSLRGLDSAKALISDRLVSSALHYVKMIERLKFYDIVISLKASTVLDTVAAYRKLAGVCSYPLHLGVTATGPPLSGVVKSSIAMGALLLEGTGDTIRVSLTDSPEQEVKAARAILEALGLRYFGPEIISCPTCGRCAVSPKKIIQELQARLRQGNFRPGSGRPVKVAVMGCVVNGPGEAKEADIGVAFGAKQGLLFKKGRPIRKVSAANCADILCQEMFKN